MLTKRSANDRATEEADFKAWLADAVAALQRSQYEPRHHPATHVAELVYPGQDAATGGGSGGSERLQ
jgi:hypothetical protein